MTSNYTSMSSMIREAKAQTAYWPRTLRLVWAAAPRSTVIWLSLLILQGLLPVILVYLTKHIVDGLVAARSSDSSWDDMRPVLALVIAFAVVMIVIEFLQSGIEWIRTTQSEMIQDHIKGLIHQQAATVDLAFYESPDYHDRMERAVTDASTRPLALLESVGSLIQNSVALLAMAVVLLPYGLWLPVALAVSTLPALFVIVRFDRRYHHWWQQRTFDRRMLQYYDGVLTRGVTAGELRIFALHGHFHGLYQTLRRHLRTERLTMMRQQSLAKLGAAAISLAITGLTVGGMVWRAMQGAVTLGDLALFYQAFSRGQGLMRSLLGSVGQIYSNTLFLGNLFAFLDLQREIVDPPDPIAAPSLLHKGIRFDHVSFRYPGSDRTVLDDFNLVVPAGKTVAIVGENGVGKSTLIRLLCRFHDPQQGRILFDDIDLRSMALDDVRRQITILFQFPVRFVASIRDNISAGDMYRDATIDDVAAAAHSAGAHDAIARTPHGYDSQLGREVAGGVELSGGEWQRVAMARAYYRQAPIMVLDEPTSFMDSWSEAEWFRRFQNLAQGRTALIITHRFTIAMRADTIHVMDRGRIVESGTHQELLALGGRYAESWWEQMRASNSTTDMPEERDASRLLEPVPFATKIPVIQQTPFVIARELPRDQHEGRILVLLENQVVEAGTHDELMARNGVYRELVTWGTRYADASSAIPQHLDTPSVALAGD